MIDGAGPAALATSEPVASWLGAGLFPSQQHIRQRRRRPATTTHTDRIAEQIPSGSILNRKWLISNPSLTLHVILIL